MKRILLTPGPLTTTASVRRAMLEDIGSWDSECIELVREIRRKLVRLAGGGARTCTLIQGSASYAVEAMLGTLPPSARLLVLVNGAYGQRIAQIATALGIAHQVWRDPEDQPHDPARVEALLASDSSLTHVACVHGETTTGLLNPVAKIAAVVQRQRRRLLVDAISTFGAYPINYSCDHLAGSANKCIEGVPGFAFVISHREAMEEATGRKRSVCLDLHAQWKAFEQTGKFRFTPPTHVLLAFRQALRELAAEGGPRVRARRYARNRDLLINGMAKLGFQPFLAPEHRSHIITTFRCPRPDFDFPTFYQRLKEKGFVIYPGKLTGADTFRVGTIGSIGSREMKGFLRAVKKLT